MPGFSINFLMVFQKLFVHWRDWFLKMFIQSGILRRIRVYFESGKICSARRLSFISGIIFLLLTNTTYARIVDAKSIQAELALNDGQAYFSSLQQFYSARNFRPVWIQSDQPTILLDEALAFIESADTEGLDNREYFLPGLRQLRAIARYTASPLLELELRTTQALLKLATHLRRGYLTAARADPDWHISQQYFDAVSFLLAAIDSGSFQESLADLPPQTPDYQQMKYALARFRELATNQVAWTKIPERAVIKPKTVHAIIPLVRKRIKEAYETHGLPEYNLTSLQNSLYDEELIKAIKAYQAQHGLITDGIIGTNTLRALNMTPEEKIQQLRLNMERLRWLPRDLGERYLLVNIAGFRLTAVELGQINLNMRIIVGQDYRSTPSFSSEMTHMVLNPFWNIPASIARKDLLPKQQKDDTFFTSQGIKVFENYAYDSEPLDPAAIDWSAIEQGFPYALRQDPGVNNALGMVKFMFPNPFSIYLHDTPLKSLFQKDIRTFSSGCIRLEKPVELADFALNEPEAITELTANLQDDETATVILPAPLPVYIVYLTTWVDEQNKIHYSPDSYGRDARALKFARW